MIGFRNEKPKEPDRIQKTAPSSLDNNCCSGILHSDDANMARLEKYKEGRLASSKEVRAADSLLRSCCLRKGTILVVNVEKETMTPQDTLKTTQRGFDTLHF